MRTNVRRPIPFFFARFKSECALCAPPHHSPPTVHPTAIFPDPTVVLFVAKIHETNVERRTGNENG